MPGILNVRGAIHGESYTLGRPLGADPSLLFEARHQKIAGTYVVRLFPHIGCDTPAALRLDRGLRSALLLRHAGIAQVVDFNVPGEAPLFVAMERLPDRSLQDALAQDGIFPLPLAVEIIEQIGEVLSAAHRLNISHGELHPDLIRLDREQSGRVVLKVLGFGWARESQLQMATSARRHSIYLAPEQQHEGQNPQGQGAEAKSNGARADQFSLGAIAYEMLAGCSYLSEESGDLADPDARRSRQPPRVAEMVLGLPDALDDVLRRALSFEPARRFTNVDEFVLALRHVAEEHQSAASSSAATPRLSPAERNDRGGDESDRSVRGPRDDRSDRRDRGPRDDRSDRGDRRMTGSGLAAAIDAALVAAVGGQPAGSPASEGIDWVPTPTLLRVSKAEPKTPTPEFEAATPPPPMMETPSIAALRPRTVEVVGPATLPAMAWPAVLPSAVPAATASAALLVGPWGRPPLGAGRPQDKRVSTGKKIAILVAASALVGGSIALLTSGSRPSASSTAVGVPGGAAAAAAEGVAANRETRPTTVAAPAPAPTPGTVAPARTDAEKTVDSGRTAISGMAMRSPTATKGGATTKRVSASTAAVKTRTDRSRRLRARHVAAKNQAGHRTRGR